tara:strand:- start:4607 stop:4858 length:252 start_codon:yes stop_codon:yes gene_type:complete
VAKLPDGLELNEEVIAGLKADDKLKRKVAAYASKGYTWVPVAIDEDTNEATVLALKQCTKRSHARRKAERILKGEDALATPAS